MIENYSQWRYMKMKLLVGLDCVLCGAPAQTLHHPTRCSDMSEYWNAENQIPVCHACHCSKLHIMSNGKYNSKTGIIWQKCLGGGFG